MVAVLHTRPAQQPVRFVEGRFAGELAGANKVLNVADNCQQEQFGSEKRASSLNSICSLLRPWPPDNLKSKLEQTGLLTACTLLPPIFGPKPVTVWERIRRTCLLQGPLQEIHFLTGILVL